MYELKQAPKAWYDRMNKVDRTFFIKKSEHNILLVPIYIDNIIFGAIGESLCKEFF